jgi:hypothetical protein
MNKLSAIVLLLITVSILGVSGCGGKSATVFLHPEYDFRYVEQIGVIPFENQSKEQGAGSRVTQVFMSELLSEKVFNIIEPGEVSRALEKYSTLRTSQLTKDQVKEIGQSLKAQALIFGTVAELTSFRSGNSTTNTVTLVVRMVDTESGETVWSTTHTSGGKGFFASLFGTGDKSQSEVIRNCVEGVLKTLID